MTYNVEYRMFAHDQVKSVDVIARNKEQAYQVATFEVIPEKEEMTPYSAWINSVTYKNGKTRFFNCFEGNAF